MDKFVAFARSQGTRLQQRRALEILLPASPIYHFLEGRVPHPSHTYERIIQIVEVDEKERTNKEIGERRTRLGAKVNQVTVEVKREVFRDSPLEDLYGQMIDWTNDDEVRRRYEEKLLERCYDTLVVLPSSQKAEKRAKVTKLANDMVIIKHPFQLAWDISLEWWDETLIENWDAGVLRNYCSFFAHTGLARVLEGFMTSEISPFPKIQPPDDESIINVSNSDSEDDEGGGVDLSLPMSAEDRLLMMIDGMSDASGSILAHRAMGEYYAFLDEHESVAEIARAGRRLVERESQKTGLKFENAFLSLTELLGTALIFFQSPKNHPEGKSLFDQVLAVKPTSTAALIGIGLIHEEEEDYPAALEFLDRAMKKDTKNVRIRAEAAWVKALLGDYKNSRKELEDCLVILSGTDMKSREVRAQIQYRMGVCMWNMHTSIEARKNRSGAYAYFLAALKSNLNLAPAYTSLGIFYSDYTKDKKRAKKCFQKALELSASEIEAAERLARAFAAKGEWELVEVVARRVVDSGKVRPAPGSKKKGFSWPFSALGVAELNKQDYAKSIVSFQSALRITPQDYHSWVGLGESYHNSGRYIAATKAFKYAEKFEQQIEQQSSGDTWFARYMLANVKRELGEYDDAIVGYKDVLARRPNEFGVSIALVQTLVDSAWDSVDKGLYGQAADSAIEAIKAGQGLLEAHPNTFNLWRSLGDACTVFSWVQGRLEDFRYHDLKTGLDTQEDHEAYAILFDVDAVDINTITLLENGESDDQGFSTLRFCVHTAILCHKRALHAAMQDVHAQAVAYYNLGCAEYRAHVCISTSPQRHSSRYLKAAVHCLKRAIELEAGNSEFWNSLGVFASELSPKIAQHSLVRSLHLNERNAQVWTNLGTLCILQNDYQLANEAFTRAQSTDPEFAHAWLGQGLVALAVGETREARLLFTHAVEISDASSQLTKRQYALSTFDNLLASKADSDIVDLVQPIFAINQLNSLNPNDLALQHLGNLFLERIGDLSAALVGLTAICRKLEFDYESTESTASLSHFALAKADHARIQLAAGQYDDAIESAETALELSAEDTGNDLSSDSRRRCRLSCHLTMSLASYFSKKIDTAVQYLVTAITEAQGNPDYICLLAQIMWATGEEASRKQARDYLFDCIESNPGHTRSMLLLRNIAFLDNDLETMDAVAVDLRTMRMSYSIFEEEQGMASDILNSFATSSGENPDLTVLTGVQADILLNPSQPNGWSRLAEFGNDNNAADMALRTAIRAVPPKGDLGAVDLARTFAGTEKLADAQRAIVFAPWTAYGWNALSDSISR